MRTPNPIVGAAPRPDETDPQRRRATAVKPANRLHTTMWTPAQRPARLAGLTAGDRLRWFSNAHPSPTEAVVAPVFTAIQDGGRALDQRLRIQSTA